MVERKGLVDKLKGNARYAHFNEPDLSYHGLVYVDVPLPPYTLRTRLSLLRDVGAVHHRLTLGCLFKEWNIYLFV